VAEDERLAMDERTALVVVDVQNDFADPAGSLHVPGGDEVVAEVAELVRRAGAAGATVVYTQDWHPERTPHFADAGGRWPVHCVRGTWGAELHPDLPVEGPVVRKGTGPEDGYSGFTVRDLTTGEDQATDLRAVLDEAGAQRLVIVGLARDVCVAATALDGRRHGYPVTVVLAATRPVEVTPGDDARARAEMEAAGVALV
jgi:nicotinamidase/pyrazinamidase